MTFFFITGKIIPIHYYLFFSLVLTQAGRQYPKFAQALADVRQHDPLLLRFAVVDTSAPLGSPAAAFPNGAVHLDRRYLEHVRALRQLVREPAYADYQRYVAAHCPAQP